MPSPRFELGMLARLFLRQVCLPFHQEGETIMKCVVPQARFERAMSTAFKAAVSTVSTIGALTFSLGASPPIRTENILWLRQARLPIAPAMHEVKKGVATRAGIEPATSC